MFTKDSTHSEWHLDVINCYNNTTKNLYGIKEFLNETKQVRQITVEELALLKSYNILIENTLRGINEKLNRHE